MSEVTATTETTEPAAADATAIAADATAIAAPESEAPAADAAGAVEPPQTLLSDDGGEQPEGEELVWQPPEGVEVTEAQHAQLGEFAGMAKEMGLSKDQFQKLIDFDVQRGQDLYTQQMDAYYATIKDWGDQTRADPELGGAQLEQKLGLAKMAQEQLSTPEMDALLRAPGPDNPNGLGIGNHPEVLRLFARVGAALNEAKLVEGGGQFAAGDELKKLYPTMFPSDN